MHKFCVGYAAAGMQNAAEGSTSAKQIIDIKALAADKRKTTTLNTQAFLIAIAVTLIACILPRF
jgi:hypothetical protein